MTSSGFREHVICGKSGVLMRWSRVSAACLPICGLKIRVVVELAIGCKKWFSVEIYGGENLAGEFIDMIGSE